MSAKKNSRKKKNLGSYPYFTVVFSITLALFTLGIFGLIFIHGATLSEKIKSNHEVQVFLNNNLSHAQQEHISTIIKSKKYTSSSKLIGKDEIMKKYISNGDNNPEELLGYNPFHTMLRVKINPSYSSENKLIEIKKELESINGVFEVEYLKDFIKLINENMQKIGLVLIGICSILILIVFVLINNTIRLALFSQRFIIRSMQLVGATSGFIQRPFLFRSLWQGALSAVIAITFLYGIMNYAYQKVEDLKLLFDLQLFGTLAIILIVIGSLIGFLSSYRAVKKYLKLSLEELY